MIHFLHFNNVTIRICISMHHFTSIHFIGFFAFFVAFIIRDKNLVKSRIKKRKSGIIMFKLIIII